MTSMIIDYDLRQPGKDYAALYETIKGYGTWAHITESTWFIKTADSCVTVRNNLLTKMDDNDRLFVGELTGNAAWHNVICSDDFLKKNL